MVINVLFFGHVQILEIELSDALGKPQMQLASGSIDINAIAMTAMEDRKLEYVALVVWIQSQSTLRLVGRWVRWANQPRKETVTTYLSGRMAQSLWWGGSVGAMSRDGQ